MKPRSLARYLLVNVALPAALVNVGVNALVGPAVYHANRPVPLDGNPSIAGDTLVGAFLIGFFTWFVVAQASRLEARAGRVRGLARASRLLAWAKRRPMASALLFGVVSLLVLGVPTVLVLAGLHVGALERAEFLRFKEAFAGAAGVVTALVAALGGIAIEKDVRDDPRWCRDPASASGVAYPFEYIDKGGLAVTSREHGCSGTPTWQLVVRGTLDPAHVQRALADLTTRYPSLTTRVQSLDGAPPVATKYRYAQDPQFSLEQIFELVDLRGRLPQLEALVQKLENRHLDLFDDFPVTLTMALTDDGCRLFFRQHHAIADGRAFIELLGDFARYLDAARAGTRPSDEALAPIGRRSEAEALALGPARQLGFIVEGIVRSIVAIVDLALRPGVPLLQNRSNDYTGDNGCVRVTLDDGVLAGWNARRKQIGVSLNSLLSAALLEALERWHRARSQPLGRCRMTLLAETRPRAGAFRSFANHLATLVVETRLDVGVDALARSVQAQVERQRQTRAPEKRLLAERLVVRGMPLEALQKIIFQSKQAVYQVSLSNLIPLAFPPLRGDGWSVDEVLITTPVAPRSGIAPTVIRYGGKIVFNFNYKSSAISRNDVEELCRTFSAVLRELDASDASLARAAE